MRSVFKQFGCFQAFYDKIPDETRKQLFGCLAEFFDRPLEEKAKNISDKVYDGYIGVSPSRPLSESLSFDGEKVDSLIDTTWPQEKSTVR